MAPLNRIDELRRLFESMAPDHIQIPIKVADRRLMPGDAQSRGENFPLFSFEVKQFYKITVVVVLGLLLQKQVIVRLNIAATSHDYVVSSRVFGVLDDTGEMLASVLAQALFNGSELLAFYVENKTFI